MAGDVKQMGPGDPLVDGMEFYQTFSPTSGTRFFALVIKSGRQSADLEMVKQRVSELDPEQPIVEAAAMAERIGESLAGPRFFLSLTSASP